MPKMQKSASELAELIAESIGAKHYDVRVDVYADLASGWHPVVYGNNDRTVRTAQVSAEQAADGLRVRYDLKT